jgi:hypothetical protein
MKTVYMAGDAAELDLPLSRSDTVTFVGQGLR